jgi:phosphatidylglycerol:prolipoprotein diacylglycerol transferase
LSLRGDAILYVGITGVGVSLHRNRLSFGMNSLVVTWDVSRVLVDLGVVEIRYYSVLFALGFVLGYFIMKGIFREEGVPADKLDTLLTYVVIATVIGARLGHVFFYQWDYYSQHPEEILMIWEGGLASHGAAIAIMVALWIYSKRVSKRSFFWIIDRVVITVALAGSLIRLGNLMNSEIYGKPTNGKFAFVYVNPVREVFDRFFGSEVKEIEIVKTDEWVETDSLKMPVYAVKLRLDERIAPEMVTAHLSGRLLPYLRHLDSDEQNLVPYEGSVPELVHNGTNPQVVVKLLGVPRVPSQIVEAVAYLLIFLVLWLMFFKTPMRQREGFTFGMFLVLVFGFRIVVEFFKANQVAFEDELVFNMGQYLSVPLVVAGGAVVVYSLTKKSVQQG